MALCVQLEEETNHSILFEGNSKSRTGQWTHPLNIFLLLADKFIQISGETTSDLHGVAIE